MGFWKLTIFYTIACDIVVRFWYNFRGVFCLRKPWMRCCRPCWITTFCVEITEVLRSLSCLRDNLCEQLCEWLKSENTVVLCCVCLYCIFNTDLTCFCLFCLYCIFNTDLTCFCLVCLYCIFNTDLACFCLFYWVCLYHTFNTNLTCFCLFCLVCLYCIFNTDLAWFYFIEFVYIVYLIQI